MITTLSDTTSAEISAALLSARRSAGSPTSGMVLTLIIVADSGGYPAALDAAMAAGREHPSRILLMVTGNGRHAAGVDAEVRIGEDTPGEVVVIRMRGQVARFPASVLRPLLLPDSPVVVWWPDSSPQDQISDSLAELTNRRITDAAAARQPHRELARRAGRLIPGDTDLAWTRLTGWRTLLAAALDQFPARVLRASVEAERGNPSADLLAAWLQIRLKRPVRQITSAGPGITAARLTTVAGDIAVTRGDGRLASYAVPGQPNRRVALNRRDLADLITEELRRMDRDPVYEQVLRALRTGGNGRRSTTSNRAQPAQKSGQGAAGQSVAKKNTAKKAATRGTAKKATGSSSSTTKNAATKKPIKKTTARSGAKSSSNRPTSGKSGSTATGSGPPTEQGRGNSSRTQGAQR